MADRDTILTECMSQHGVVDMDADAPVVLKLLDGWLAHKQKVARSYSLHMKEVVDG